MGVDTLLNLPSFVSCASSNFFSFVGLLSASLMSLHIGIEGFLGAHYFEASLRLFSNPFLIDRSKFFQTSNSPRSIGGLPPLPLFSLLLWRRSSKECSFSPLNFIPIIFFENIYSFPFLTSFFAGRQQARRCWTAAFFLSPLESL